MATQKNTDAPTGLAALREPFSPNQISKLPKPTKAQNEAVKADFKKGKRCQVCGGWHHPDVVHLDYVGHAALTARLLDVDPQWNWEPAGTDPTGLPLFDQFGGMWIRLTVCGQTRLGYGDSGGKKGPDAIKEVIGDALRNAAMRFGAALDLWHKGDLKADEPDEPTRPEKAAPQEENPFHEEDIKEQVNRRAKAVKDAVLACETHIAVDKKFTELNDELAWIKEQSPNAYDYLVNLANDHKKTFYQKAG